MSQGLRLTRRPHVSLAEVGLAGRVLVLDDGRIATEQRLDGGASHAELGTVVLRALGVTDDDRDPADHVPADHDAADHDATTCDTAARDRTTRGGSR
ncbi:hypothetical protein [Nonomuraea fuscirosea]|uniref:hypothetical protein n=1 Tax=Nonomuraea fuscirosea TaxID=1291556 RepID=UPI00341DA9ED